MKNIIQYVETELNGLDTREFSPVDSLVLSQLSYVFFDEAFACAKPDSQPLTIGQLYRAEWFPSMFRDVRDPASNKLLLTALAASPRFRDIRLNYYESSFDAASETQFAAVTYLLDDGTAYIAYRGTDATFIGWKEDFNMAYISPVPAQEKGLEYILRVTREVHRQLRVGGHSKGGNLAVYAAINCPEALQNRIIDIYSHDGPGFKDNVFETEGYRRVAAKLHKTIPQSSLIGMLMQVQENYRVVQSSRFSVMQHDPFSWSVEDHDFTYLGSLTPAAAHRSKVLGEWLDNMTIPERERFVDALYTLIGKADVQTVNEFAEEWPKKAVLVLEAFKDIDPDTRKFLLQLIKELAALGLRITKQPLLKLSAEK